jgi:D-sedoheptulose 7-phosphate isomerase
MKDAIKQSFLESIKTKEQLISEPVIRAVEEAVNEISLALRYGKKILICGNGGSAADSQHFAAELTGRYMMERKSLAAIALTTDTSALTAIGNDYGFEKVFSRQVEGLGEKGDVLIGISTSGNSKNVIEAVKMAKEKGLRTICFLGASGALKDICDLPINVPSTATPRIQECHELIMHTICDLVEKSMFSKQ